MSFLGQNIDSSALLVISSFCAVFMSVVSIVISIVFSLLQIRHNKYSVRPISAIEVKDYEDLLAVSIANKGTGPLIVKRMRCKRSKKYAKEHATLIEMMPDISAFQQWSTFTECIDGWTIPVGGTIVLLELRPYSDFVKTRVRKSLSQITIYLEYADIYKTKFRDKRKLDFFARLL